MKIKCPKCGSSNIGILRARPHGLIIRDINRAGEQVKTKKVYGFVCFNNQCDFRVDFKKPKDRKKALEWLKREFEP
ncbi:hypothetical protein KJA15_03595 [Patescibacteria group bacterium]|nr:hypothetical protein [Patescibacteria group bacterium]